MASKLYGVAKVRNTKTNAWCLQWNRVWQCPYVGLHECCWCRGAAFHWWASWILKCTALYWKRRCYHHSVPLVVVHFSNMTMILNTHLRPLLDFWRRTGWKWFSGQVCLLIWTQTPMGNSEVEHHSPSSIQSLKEVILEEWKKIDLAKCHQLFFVGCTHFCITLIWVKRKNV